MALRVFVAQVDVDLRRLDHPGRDQHPFEKAVRVGLEEIAVLEGAGLALVGVDRQQPRRRLLAHQTPFASGRKPGAAEPAQAGVFEDFDQFLGLALPGEAGREQAIAAGRAIGIETGKIRDRRVLFANGNRGGDIVDSRVLVQRVPDRHNRRTMAPAHARGANDPDPLAEPAAQSFEQPRRAGQLAAQAVAHPHGQRGRWRLAVHDDVEMGIERGDLVDLDEGEPHLLGERRQMPRVQATEMVLQQVQMLDQQVAPALALSPSSAWTSDERGGIDLPPLRMIRPAPPPGAGVDAPVVSYRSAHLVPPQAPLRPQGGRGRGPRAAREGEVGVCRRSRSPPPHPDPLPPKGRRGGNCCGS